MNSLVRPSNMWTGQLLYISANIGLWILLRPSVPAQIMHVWEIFAFLCLASMAGFHIAYARAEARGVDALRRWIKVERFAALGDELLAIASIFMLLPHAGGSEMLFATAFYIGYIPSGILSEPGNVLRLRRSVVLVLGSFALFLAIYGDSSGKVLSLVVAGYAVFLLKGIGSVHRIVRQAVSARQDAQEANKALNLALSEVSAERDAKTRFIAAASHDLGQPLQAANLFAEQLTYSTSPQSTKRALDGVLKAVGSAQQMLSHMLSHMRLEADAVSPHPAPVLIGELLEGLALQYGPEALQSGIEIIALKSRTILYSDVVLLNRAIGNLILNGLIHSGATRLLLAARKKAGRIEIWVIDDGIGIPDGEVDLVFEDYQTGSNSRAKIKGGFGLGLSSVRRLAKLLGGEAMLDTRWRKGSAFVLSLPYSGVQST